MYEISFRKRAIKDYVLIEKDKNLFNDLEYILKELQLNPFRPNLSQSRIGIEMTNEVYYVKLTKKDEILKMLGHGL